MMYDSIAYDLLLRPYERLSQDTVNVSGAARFMSAFYPVVSPNDLHCILPYTDFSLYNRIEFLC